MLIIILFSLPLIAALISIPIKKIQALEILATFVSAVELVASIFIALEVAKVGKYEFGSYFSLDGIGAIVLLIVTTVGLFTTLYTLGYFRAEVAKRIVGFRRVRQYIVLQHVFFAAMIFAVSTTSPILMWIAIEATTLSTAFLVSFYNKPSAMEAAWKYLIINSVGLLLGFLGTLLFFASIGNTAGDVFVSWQQLIDNAAHLNPLVAKMAFIILFVGYGTKAGLVPMHTWKPDVYSKVPAPLGALFSGPLLAVAFLALLRYKIIVDAALGFDFSRNIFMYFGIASLVVTAFIIFTQKNYKRLFAYSSIEHAGIIALGIGFGGAGTFAAILHMTYHALAKPIVFFASGNMLLKYGSTKMARVKGMLRVLPVTSVILILGFLAITGIPPFGMFLTEFNILSAGISQNITITIIAVTSLALIFAGFLRHVSGMVFGEAPQQMVKGESNGLTVVPIILLIAVFIVASFYLPNSFLALLHSATALIQ